MTKKQKMLSGILVALSGIACFSAGIAYQNVNAADDMSSITIEESYAYTSEFVVPEATYEVNGAKYEAAYKVVMPDGSESTSPVVELTQVGVYDLVYSANVDGTKQEEKYSFRVDYPLVLTESSLSTVTYEEYNGIPGLNCSIRCGESLTFSQPIDISWLRSTDSIFEFFLLPSSSGAMDFSSMEIVLTDYYDPDNYLRISNTPYRNDPTTHSYSDAAGPGQLMSGLDIGGERMWVNDIYGAAIKSFDWVFSVDPEDNRLAFSFDKNTNQVFGNNVIIADLDDPIYFETLWEGFTSNLVTLTVKPTEGSTAKFFITEVYGTDLSKATINDTLAPVITVDTLTYSADALPKAMVGNPYKIFQASAMDDMEGVVNVSAKVYKNYYSSARVSVSQKNGMFTPDRVATYYLEYTAKDVFDNVTTTVLQVEALGENDITPLAVTASGGARTALAGVETEIASFVATGGSGDVSIEVKVSDGKGTTKEVDGQTFTPWNNGTYTVTAEATDFIGNVAETEYTVTVSANPNPIFEGEAYLSSYMVAGQKYKIPTLTAKDYSGNAVKIVTAKCTVLNSSASISGDAYIPSNSDIGKSITVRYTATGSSGSSTKDYNITVVSGTTNNSIDLSKYFAYNGGASGMLVYNSSEKLVRTTVPNNSSIDFINALMWQRFELKFKPDSQDGEVIVELTGQENKDEVLKFTYVKKNGKVSLVVNDTTNFTLKTSEIGQIYLSYDKSKSSFYSVQTKLNISTFLNGEKFNGFTGGFVTLRISIANTAATGTLDLFSVNSQTLGVRGDYVSPNLLILGEYGGTKLHNAVETVADLLYADVVSSYVEATVSVKAPNESFVKDLNGKTLNNVAVDQYQFKCEEYGAYEVIYTVTDFSGNSFSDSYFVYIINTTPPTIKLNATVASTYTVGSTLTIPTATYMDDRTAIEDIKYCVTLLAADGTCFAVEGTQITLNQRGKYILTYLAVDGDGNITFLDCEFTVN